MLPDPTDLVQAFLIPAAGAGLLKWGRGPSDEDLQRRLDEFRIELRAQFAADRERQTVSRAKLEALAAEWAPRVENEEIGRQIADLMSAGMAVHLSFYEQRVQDRGTLRRLHDEISTAAIAARPQLRPYVQGWIDDGKRLADENIGNLRDLLDRVQTIEADFRVANVAPYLSPPDVGGTASFDDQIAIGTRLADKYRAALRELAK